MYESLMTTNTGQSDQEGMRKTNFRPESNPGLMTSKPDTEPRGGFRHNEIRDLTATLLSEVCNDVQVEPEFTTETMSGQSANTTNGARLDVAASGFWGGRREKIFVDVRVFNPSNCNTNLDRCFAKHEHEKIQVYGKRAREIKHASFVPLVMSATGVLAKQATNFYKRLASLLADKWEQPYRNTLYWLDAPNPSACSALPFSVYVAHDHPGGTQ